jgi:hypothetical protein
MPKVITQIGGGTCSLCGAPGVTKVSCPANKQSTNPNPAKHNVAKPAASPQKTTKPKIQIKSKLHSTLVKDASQDVFVGVANIVDGNNVIFDFTMISKDQTKVIASIAPWKSQYGNKLKNFYVVNTKMDTNYITHGILNEPLVHKE